MTKQTFELPKLTSMTSVTLAAKALSPTLPKRLLFAEALFMVRLQPYFCHMICLISYFIWFGPYFSFGEPLKRIFSNEITYPFYSNRTSESVQCSSDLCNDDESFYENSVTNFDHHDEKVSCYNCTGQREQDPDSCRNPNQSTPTCQAGLPGRQVWQLGRKPAEQSGESWLGRLLHNSNCLKI